MYECGLGFCRSYSYLSSVLCFNVGEVSKLGVLSQGYDLGYETFEVHVGSS